VLLDNLLAALNFADVFKNKKTFFKKIENVWKIKNVKNVKRERNRKNVKNVFYICSHADSCD